ncbi:MAG: hypothetical protein KF886_25960 [Candidatus Hydrogenedentes bacterium]|nr:hypothetical protein [Candidatus Hydrogenedentota bacterium]
MKPWRFTFFLAQVLLITLACGSAIAAPQTPVQVVLPDDLAAALAADLPPNLQPVPRSGLDAEALVAHAAAGGAIVWIGSPDGLPPELWIQSFELSPEPLNISQAAAAPVDLPAAFQMIARAESAFLYSANEFPKHNIDEEIRADFLPILAARDRFGEVIGYPGVLVSHVAPSLVKNRFDGCQAYFFFFEDPLAARHENRWRELLAAIALRHESGLQVEYVETNYASYRPGERAQIRARIRNFRSAGASLNVRFSIAAPGDSAWRTLATVRRVAGGDSATEAVADFPVSGPDGLHRIRVEVLQDVALAEKTAVLGAPEVIEARETAIVVLSEGWSTPELLTVDGLNFAIAGEPGFYAGTHYYPSNVWWEWAWRDFRPALADRDFRGMRQAGNRIVRVWADPTLDEISLRAKDAAVWIAASHGIVLDVCVFNQWVRDLSYPGEDGAQVDFEFRHPKDFNLYSFSLRNFDHQRNYIQTLARRWPRAGNVLYNLANETYVKDPDASQMDPEVRAWDEAALPSGERRDSLLFQRWGEELEQAVRDAGGAQMVFPGYMFSLSIGGDAFLGNALAPFMTWHGYFSPEGIGQTVHYFDSISSDRPLLLEEFGNLGWNNAVHYDAAMHYALAAGAGAAMSYEWGISWMARESSFVPLPMRDALEGADPRWFQPIVDYARENASESGVGIAPWPSGWGYGSIYHGTPFPAEAAEAVQRMARFGDRFARASQPESVYAVIPEANTVTLNTAMPMFKHLWARGVRFGVWQEVHLDALPDSAKWAILPAPLSTDQAQAALRERQAMGLVVLDGAALTDEAMTQLPAVDFAPADGINMLVRHTVHGPLYAFLSERIDVDLTARIDGREVTAELDNYVLVQSSPGGPTLIEASGTVAVDGDPVFSAEGGRVIAASVDGSPLRSAARWKVAVSSAPTVLDVPRAIAGVEVLRNDSGQTARVEIAPGATQITIDREMARYPVLIKFQAPAQ